MAEIDGLEPDLALTFFKRKGFPAVKEYHTDYLRTECDTPADTDEPLLVGVLMNCIHTLKVPLKQVYRIDMVAINDSATHYLSCITLSRQCRCPKAPLDTQYCH